MGTAYIEMTVTASERGVYIFETDLVCEVEYQVDDADGSLAEFHVSDFRFDDMRSEWDAETGTWARVCRYQVWCPDILRGTLHHYLDQGVLEEKLVEQLTTEGILSYGNDALRADYNAAVF